MKQIFTTMLGVLFLLSAKAQNKMQSNIIEGGKAVIELIKVLKTPKQKMSFSPTNSNQFMQGEYTDSCAIKQRCDLSYKNNSSKSIFVSLQKRNGDTYDNNIFSLKVGSGKEEWLYQMRAGIYKYRIENELNGVRLLINEGEIKLNACESESKVITD